MPSIASRTVSGNIIDANPTDGRPGAPSQALAAPIASSGTTITRGLLPSGTMIPGQAALQFAGNNGPVPTQYLWPVAPVSPVVQKAQLNATPQQPVPEPPVQPGQPREVVSISASSEPYKTSDATVKCAVSVSFVPYPYDPNCSNVRIWFAGYHGSTTPQLMAEGPTSPVSFLCDPTGENVTVYAEAISNQGQTSKGPITSYAPKDTIDLASTVGIPPTPSLAQTLTGTPTGYQFAFNQLAGLAANVIDGYAVYRNTSMTPTGATQINYLKHNPANATPVVVLDVAGQGQTFFYWVSAYDTSGNESNLLAAQDGTITPLSTFTPAGQIWGPATITGVQAAQMTMQEMHDATGLTRESSLLQNANFVSGDVGWTPQVGWSVIAGSGYNSSPYLGKFTGSATALLSNNQKIPCAPGNVISASCYTVADAGATGTAQLMIAWYQADGTFISWDLSPAAVADQAWHPARVVATAPALTGYATINFAVFGPATLTRDVGGFTASLLANSVDEVPNGTNYVRTSTANVDPSTGAVTGFQGQGALATVNQADTQNIVVGAVNTQVSLTAGGIIPIAASTDTTLGSAGTSEAGGFVCVRALFYGDCSAAGSTSKLQLSIYRGSALIGGQIAPLSVGNSPYVFYYVEEIDASPDPSQVYSAVVTESGGNAATAFNFRLVVDQRKV